MKNERQTTRNVWFRALFVAAGLTRLALGLLSTMVEASIAGVSWSRRWAGPRFFNRRYEGSAQRASLVLAHASQTNVFLWCPVGIGHERLGEWRKPDYVEPTNMHTYATGFLYRRQENVL